MGVFTKLKNIFYDEEYIDEPENEIKIDKPVKREIKKEIVSENPKVESIKVTGFADEDKIETVRERREIRSEHSEPSYSNQNSSRSERSERELFKSEKTFNFTEFDDEELPPRRNVLDYDRSVPKREEPKRTEVEQPKVFKPSPVISPIYGILDKDYKKEEIRQKSPSSKPTQSSATVSSYDSVRKKAYGTLEDTLEDTLNSMNKLSTSTIKENIDSIDKDVEELNRKADKIDDLINSIESSDISIGELEDKVKEEIYEEDDTPTISDNTLEHDLFNLIDSMYDDKE